MRKTKIAAIIILLMLSMIVVVSARQSSYFNSYSASITPMANGMIGFNGSIVAVGTADKLGVITVNIIDADSGAILKTATHDYRYDDSSYYFYTSAQGTVGNRYYAEVTYVVYKGQGSESKYMTVGAVTAYK